MFNRCLLDAVLPADGKVSLLGHSAGGWLARLYMGEFGIQGVALLVTLGSPHLYPTLTHEHLSVKSAGATAVSMLMGIFGCRPPPKGVKGVIDQTRGLLDYIQATYPGAFHAPDVKYVCISGRYN